MSHATFLYVSNEISTSVKKNDTIMRNVIPVEQRVALTLWFLSTGTDYRQSHTSSVFPTLQFALLQRKSTPQ